MFSFPGGAPTPPPRRAWGPTHAGAAWKAWAFFVGVYVAFFVLRNIASRTHWLARKAEDSDIAILAELSRRCAVDAVVEGLRRGESKGAKKNS